MQSLKIIKNAILLTFMGLSISCKDFVAIKEPVEQLATKKVYSNDEIAMSAIRGIYVKMMTTSAFSAGNVYSITLLVGRSADDFVNYSSDLYYRQFAENDLLPDNSALKGGLWQSPYQIIYAANSVLENLKLSANISPAVKKQLSGEAKFIRAFCHFYLCSLFGEVPIILTTDYRVNAISFASTKAEIYAQLIKDLMEAKDDLLDDYPSTERIRANKWAAAALLGRVYLYNEEWKNAEKQASEIIQQNQYSLPDDLNQVFLKNSPESILQFVVPTSLSVNTWEGNRFILTAAPTASTIQVVLSPNLLQAFEPGDQRAAKWVGTYTNGSSSWKYPFKYKVKTGSTPRNEYTMILRLAEQYLIRAEARIQLNNISAGIEDLNKLRTRARALATVGIPNPLPPLSSVLGKADALLAVEQERRIELFSEWGHRWLDLKRTNRADAVLKSIKGASWQHTDVFYPIPATELLNAPNLKPNEAN